MESEARPRPRVGRRDQTAIHRVAVQVVQLFQPLPFTPDMEITEPPLPDPAGAVVVHGGRQPEPLPHLPAPGKWWRLSGRLLRTNLAVRSLRLGIISDGLDGPHGQTQR
jgi:hypothetical protein